MGNKGGKMKISKKKNENGAAKDAEPKQEGDQPAKTEGDQPASETKPEATPEGGEKTVEGEGENKVAQVLT